MAAYTKNSPGAPVGKYNIGDTVTDSEGVVWTCVQPGNPATFEANGVAESLGAESVGYDNGTSGLTAEDAQAAIDEVVDRVATLETDTAIDASGFSGNLSPTDTDVQTALETIDGLSLGGGASAPTEVTGAALDLSALTSGSYVYILNRGAGVAIALPPVANGPFDLTFLCGASSAAYTADGDGAEVIDGQVVDLDNSLIISFTAAATKSFGDGGGGGSASFGDTVRLFSISTKWIMQGLHKAPSS